MNGLVRVGLFVGAIAILANTWTLTKKDPSPPVDEKLTAEEVFKANNNDVAIARGFRMQRPPIDARQLSETEMLKLQGLFRIHEMADFVLYKNRRGYPSFTELSRMESQFKRLPIDWQNRALDHQTRAIEAVKPYDILMGGGLNENMKLSDPIPLGALRIPGGWQSFCKWTHEDIDKHEHDSS
jgi:hypothetical protein